MLEWQGEGIETGEGGWLKVDYARQLHAHRAYSFPLGFPVPVLLCEQLLPGVEVVDFEVCCFDILLVFEKGGLFGAFLVGGVAGWFSPGGGISLGCVFEWGVCVVDEGGGCGVEG